MMPMQRFLPPTYEDGIQAPRRSIFNGNLPSPRKISTTIHRDRNRSVQVITLMLMQWGQFLDHDITLTATARAFNSSVPSCCLPGNAGFLPTEFMHPECMPIEVPHDDWFLSRFGTRCMEFIRSAPATRVNCDLGWREQINQVTSCIDGSMVYGSDVRRAESLRTFRDGTLQYGRRGSHRNPPDPPDGEICRTGAISTSCFLGGDSRFGEQPALTALHTIWLRFHNKIARDLQGINPHWSDEKLYQEARRIIGALIQHITYKEFLPIVLGPEVIDLFELKLMSKEYYTGYNSKVNPTTANAFSAAAFRFGHSLVQNSFVRSTINHQRLRNNVSIHDEQENPENIWSHGSLDRLILGLCNQPPQMRDEFIGDELTNHLFQSSDIPFGMDLAAINIQRGRDHGIPSYTSWRQPCGLSPINDWNDLAKVMRAETINLFRSLYAHVDDIDLYPGGLAEKPVRGGIVGPVFACVIAQQFLNYRKGDRFWYENGNFPSSFTPAQLQQIRKVNFAHIICHTISEIHTIQPFVFVASGNQNSRIACDNLISDSLDLLFWTEGTSNFNSLDLDSEFGFKPVHKEDETLPLHTPILPINQQFIGTVASEDEDFDFEKGFQETVNALNLINSEDPITIDDKLEIININDLTTESIDASKLFVKRDAKPVAGRNNLILMRNLKNMKINELLIEELKKSANISSSITVLPHSLLEQKVLNRTILLLKRNNSSSSDRKVTDEDLTNKTKGDKNGSVINATNNINISKFLKYLDSNNNTATDLRQEKEENSDVSGQKLRNIDEYILDTLSDYYYDYDYDATTKKKNKRKNPSTNRRKQTSGKTTLKPPALYSSTKRPNGVIDEEHDVGTYEDDEAVVHGENGYGQYDNEDIGLDDIHTNLKYPDDIKKVHYADDYVNDPITTNDDSKDKDSPSNYQFLINIHVHPTVKPTQTNEVLTKRPLRPTYDKDKHLIQVSLLQTNNKTNKHNGHHKFIPEIATKRPSTSYPIYILKPSQKVTYVTGYMVEESTTKATNMHVIPVYGTKRPVTSHQTNKQFSNTPETEDIDANYNYFHPEPSKSSYTPSTIETEDIDVNYNYFHPEPSKSSYTPIIILRPHESYNTNTQGGYDVPVHKLSSYLTSKPSTQTIRQTTREPQTLGPTFPSYLYTRDDKRKNNFYSNFDGSIHYINAPTKLTSSHDDTNGYSHHIDDKLDFKTNLFPNRLKPTSNKNYVKISSVKGDYRNANRNNVESKEQIDDQSEDIEVVLPELEGIEVVQVDVLPSDDEYKSTDFNVTEDSFVMPQLKLFSDTDCTSELPTPMINTKRATSSAA
ncbi:peroxidase [Oryctes borbonicus]|uniref:Peroxidase n=1 Tax=Oryctes borbonicus TaxID=1629725 RepID=A0A0T6BCE9_9SCAR|nr:peroxidase [Oryctes borbonicus]